LAVRITYINLNLVNSVMKKLIVLLMFFLMVGVVSAIECSEADYDGDGDVDFMDVFQLRQCINISVSEVEEVNCSFFDYDGSGMVEENDLAKYREWSAKTCPVVVRGCEDSDGGKDYYVRGIVNGIERRTDGSLVIMEDGTPDYGDFEDSCDGEILGEFYCEDDEGVFGEAYECPNGCEDGACIELVPTEYYLVVDDSAPIGDVTMSDLIASENFGYHTFTRALNSEITIETLENSFVVFLSDEKVLIILDENAPSSEFLLATEISAALEVLGLITVIVKNTEITSEDLLVAIAQFDFDENEENEENDCDNCDGFEKAEIECADGSSQEVKGTCKSLGKWQDYASQFCEQYGGPKFVEPFSLCYVDDGAVQIGDEDENDEEGDSDDDSDSSNVLVECDNGCSLDNRCYNYGFRKWGEYCSDAEGKFIEQKSSEESCDNNFECDSNICVDDECVSAGLMRRILNWFKGLFGG